MSEEKILKKLNNHDKNFKNIELKLDNHTKVLDEHGKKIDKHQAILDKLVVKTLEHDDRFDRIEDKIQETEDRILSAIDLTMKKILNVNQEQILIGATLDRNEEEILHIKKAVKLV